LALYYLETSALVKLYIREAGTERLLRLAARARSHRLIVLVIAVVEFHSAIRRRERAGDIDSSLAKSLLSRFDQHLETRFVKQVLNDSVIDVAIGLVARHALRAYDAVQLAGCLVLRAASGRDEPTFVCSDRQLLEAAGAEGVLCLDPSGP
jgi:predicted nucleic acid-binding protein